MAQRRRALLLICLSLSVFASGCGYSEDQWQAQLAKYNQLKAERRREARRRPEEDRRPDQAAEGHGRRGLARPRPTSPTARRPSPSTRTRARQLELIKAALREAQGEARRAHRSSGLAVNVRHNRMVISLPGDVLFDSGHETLKKDGQGHPAEGRRASSRPTRSSCRATTRSPATPTTSPSRAARSRTTGACP